MQFGLSLPNNYGVEDVQAIVRLATTAEQLGFHSVWVSEHLFNVEYVFQRLGNRPYYEPLTILTAVATVTQTVRLGTSVLVLPYHHPVRLAKTVATLDALSGGRVILGVGVGVIEAEFRAVNSPFAARGAMTDEAIAAMQALWTQEDPSFTGQFYNFAAMKFSPKPVQRPYPPLWIGGASRAAIRRAAHVGDGWHPVGLSLDDLRRGIHTLREQAAALGRDPSRIAISIRSELDLTTGSGTKPVRQRFALQGTAAEISEQIHACEREGVETIVLSMNTGEVTQIHDTITRFAQDVMPAFSR